MKKIGLVLLIVIACALSSCINDIGNYDYLTEEDVISLTINGFDDTTAVIGDLLEITPTIENMDNEGRYTYLWYASKSVTAGMLPVRDTLSLERNLSVQIKMEADTYNLVFIVQDPVQDVYVRKSVSLKVEASSITGGWYVLKEVNDETDFDYIRLDGSEIMPDVLRNQAGYQEFRNGPAAIGNQQLKGKPVKMIYQNTRYYHMMPNQDGTTTTLANQKALHILSDREMKTFNSVNLYRFKENEEQFYEELELSPQNVAFYSSDLYLINANKCHSIYGMSINAGKFSFAKSTSLSPQYALHPDMIASVYGAVVFDTTTRSFFQTTSSGATLNKMAEPAGNEFPSLTNMEHELVHWLRKEVPGFYLTGYCVMRNVANGKYYIGYFSTMGNTNYPFTSFREVPSNAKMPTADVLASPQYASCIYFANGNVLSYYIDAPDLENPETVIKTFPSDETVSYIANPITNTLIVLTNSASGWKLYGFPIIGTTPDIETEPTFVYSGSGAGRYVMYRSS